MKRKVRESMVIKDPLCIMNMYSLLHAMNEHQKMLRLCWLLYERDKYKMNDQAHRLGTLILITSIEQRTKYCRILRRIR